MLCVGRFAVLNSVLGHRNRGPVQDIYGRKKKKKKRRNVVSSQEQDEKIAQQTLNIEKWLSDALHLPMSEIKPVIEAHMTEKCNMRRSAEKNFKVDIRNLIIYTVFLVLFWLRASSADNQSILNVRNMVTPAIVDFGNVSYSRELCFQGSWPCYRL
jgi:hypothetical protein